MDFIYRYFTTYNRISLSDIKLELPKSLRLSAIKRTYILHNNTGGTKIKSQDESEYVVCP